MKLNIYTCNCLLDHLIKMSEEEIEKYIMNHVIFSLSDRWMMYIHTGPDILFFCLRTICFVRVFINERVFCIKRSGLFDDTCLDLVDFTGINNCCQNCLTSLVDSFKKYLLKVKK